MTLAPFPTTDLAAGRRLIGRYRIVREIGRGGSSVVYEADDVTVGTPVALKLLVASPLGQAEAKERLRREVEAVRGLRHPGIVGLHDFLEADGLAFVVMDLIDGEDLARRIAAAGPLEPARAIELALEAASALAAAHRAGILHRDIKPANILLDRAGHAHLADFGAARLDGQASMTRTGSVVGTVAYLAPEVWQGGRADPRADIYALGVTLYEALTGSLPPRLSPHLPPTPEPGGFRPSAARGGLAPWLDEVVANATTANPRLRFPTAEAFAEALERRTFPPRPMVAATLAAIEPVEQRRAMPVSFRVLLGGVVATGLMAGWAATSVFYPATPIVTWLLWRSWRERDRKKPARPPVARWQLIGSALDGYQRLPDGPARSLLDDVLILARTRIDHAGTQSLGGRWRAELEPIVATAVETATDLARADDVLQHLEQAGGHARRIPVGYWASLADLERTRDGLAALLLELIATLGRAEQIAAEDFDSARFRLEEMVGDLKGDLDRTVLAARNLEAALAGPAQRPIASR